MEFTAIRNFVAAFRRIIGCIYFFYCVLSSDVIVARVLSNTVVKVVISVVISSEENSLDKINLLVNTVSMLLHFEINHIKFT